MNIEYAFSQYFGIDNLIILRRNKWVSLQKVLQQFNVFREIKDKVDNSGANLNFQEKNK